MRNGMAKLYDRLTAKERTSALMAAVMRGDDAEQHRLNSSAPWRAVKGSHHSRRVQAVLTLTTLYRSEQLGRMADYWFSLTRMAWLIDEAEAGDDASPLDGWKKWKGIADGNLYRAALNKSAWPLVCEQLGIVPEFLDTLGECVALELSLDGIDANAPTADELRATFAALGGPVPDLATVETVTAEWLDLFRLLGGD